MRSGQLFRAHNAASAAPLGTIEFALDFRKIGSICRGDVGIAPYAEPKNFRNPVGADDPVRPEEVSNSPRFSVKIGFFCGRTEPSAPTNLP